MIIITELAAQKVKEVLKAQNKEASYLRIFLAGAGCSGPNFGMAIDETKTDDDILDEEYGVSILTDKKLSPQLEGAILDYIESSNGSGFQIRTLNPDPGDGCSSGCAGCGGGC